MNHDFCRTLLSLARQEAKDAGVSVPKNITALRADRRQYFVEYEGAHRQAEGVYIAADCAIEARAKFISSLVDKTQTTEVRYWFERPSKLPIQPPPIEHRRPT
jgi:hypothetical protein